MQIMKDLMLKSGTDLEKIRKDFFESGDDCTLSIRNSKTFIVEGCMKTKKSIWDFVRNEQEDIAVDKDYTDYQKMMVSASLLLAWEELERDEPNLVFEIYDNAKTSS